MATVVTFGHFIHVCSCGRVMAQCRCASPEKAVHTSKDACGTCMAKKLNETVEEMMRGYTPVGSACGGKVEIPGPVDQR